MENHNNNITFICVFYIFDIFEYVGFKAVLIAILNTYNFPQHFTTFSEFSNVFEQIQTQHRKLNSEIIRIF